MTAGYAGRADPADLAALPLVDDAEEIPANGGRYAEARPAMPEVTEAEAAALTTRMLEAVAADTPERLTDPDAIPYTPGPPLPPVVELSEAERAALEAAHIIKSIDDYRADVPTEVPWICQPLAYSGGVTLIAGPPKAGKSTLAAQLQRCRESGAPLFGTWDVATGPVLLVTEEGGVAVVHKSHGLHELDILDRRAAAGLSFMQVLEVVAAWARRHPGGLAFIDTLAIFAGIENENDASEASRAVALVTAVAQSTDLAVVLVHHARKSGGDNGEAIRGSGAILATVDIAAELSRVSPGSDDRWLDVQGRVILPERYLLAFDRSTMAYTLADKAAANLESIEADLAGIPADGPGLTRNDLQALWRKDPRARADQLVNVGRMRTEYVKSGRAYAWRYWSIPAAWTPPMDRSR